MSQNLAKQRALVTGASSGIGETIARAFAEAGASVIVNYLSHQKWAERIVNDIREHGGVAMAVEGTYPKRKAAHACLKQRSCNWAGLTSSSPTQDCNKTPLSRK